MIMAMTQARKDERNTTNMTQTLDRITKPQQLFSFVTDWSS
jgi:hypothetical protein